MESLPRDLSEKLLTWKRRERPKPILLRGPRQVGKSTAVRSLGKTYDHYIELNLEVDRLARMFERLPEVAPFLQGLYTRAGIAPAPHESVLLFIDEIQEAPIAIQFLRYLYEDQDHVHVIAAGSLLEFAIGRVPSFPVGRVIFEAVYPLSFREFLTWTGRSLLAEKLAEVPVAAYAHPTIAEAFREYTFVGGMPEAVKQYAATESIAELDEVYRSIWSTYQADLERHATTDTQRRLIRFLLASAPKELDRFAYANFGGSGYRSRDVREGLEMMEMARIIRIVRPTISTSPPPMPHLRGRPRLQFMDTGLLNYAAGLHSETVVLDDIASVYRGRLGMHVVTQELIGSQKRYSYEPYFWIRENKKSNAEVDLVHQYRMELLGFEVKSGSQGRLRSLHQYVERAGSRLAIRALDNTASVEDVRTPAGHAYRLLNIPLYATAQIDEYIAWALEQP